MNLWNNKLYQKELESIEIPNNIWERLYGKTILITGATGMVCSFLVDVLMNKNEILSVNEKISLIIPVRDMQYAEKRFLKHLGLPYFQLIQLDITNIRNEIDGFKFDYIIAGAGCADPKQFSEYPVDTMVSNLYGLTHLLDRAREYKNVRILYISTGEIYGNAGTDIDAFKEDDSYYINSMDVRACYPNSKRAAETFCVAYFKQYNVDTVIGRLCYVYGPTIKDSDSRSVAQFLRNAAKGENIILKSSGEQIRSYCYIVDIVSALLFLLIFGVSGEAYNIASAECNCSIAEFAKMVAKAAGVKCVYAVAKEQDRMGYSKVLKAIQCPQKINTLGWNAEISLKSGIEKTVKILNEFK